MQNKLVPLALVALLVIVHGQIWIGRGSVPNVQGLTQQLAQQRSANEAARLANQRLEAEVRDLKEGMEMVEEKARSELGMVRPNEILVVVTK
jgi:cell division protein FtsB